jgi:hypothetical protein
VEAASATRHQFSHTVVNATRVIIIFSMLLPSHVSSNVRADIYKWLKKIAVIMAKG